MTRVEQLQKLIDEKFNSSQSELARVLGKSPAQVHQWIKGHRNIGDGVARHIETTLKLPIGWLDGRINLAYATVKSVNHNLAAPPMEGYVPVLTWEMMAKGMRSTSPETLSQVQEWLPCPRAHGPDTFALPVKGDSMVNGSARPSFYDGDVIFIDPSLEVRHHALVVVQPMPNAAAMFRRLVIDGDQHMAEALNPAWPERISRLPANYVVHGVVIAWMGFL